MAYSRFDLCNVIQLSTFLIPSCLKYEEEVRSLPLASQNIISRLLINFLLTIYCPFELPYLLSF